MPSMTDYLVLSDGAFTLNDGEAKNLDFTLPNNFTVGVNLAKPVLAFIINPKSRKSEVGGWVNPTVSPFLSSEQVISLSWNTDNHADYGLWEAIDGRQFKAGESNQISFKSWDGQVVIRDVILWFQRGAGG
ncbi:hypothetical protein [uncultured Marivita sp.]|uniref:hypothetical protein n=1 Tax=uncultured Marivita sp. TaxID=888080 RepID=UPI002629A173|nr:hypothetical protein [uncultured Marivita sp.]